MNIAEVIIYAMCVVMSGICIYLYIQIKNE